MTLISLFLVIIPAWSLFAVAILLGGGLYHTATAERVIDKSRIALSLFYLAAALLISSGLALYLSHDDPRSTAACLIGNYGRNIIPILSAAMVLMSGVMSYRSRQGPNLSAWLTRGFLLFALCAALLAWAAHLRSALLCTM